jgi:hypothetical protein
MSYSPGGMIPGPGGKDSMEVRLTVGEQLIGMNGKIWEWTALPDTAPQMFGWVRVNTDEQASAFLGRMREILHEAANQREG